MAEKSETFKLDYYLGLVIKRRWFIIIPFCIAMVVGMYLSVTLPKIYEAGTMILVMPQRVPSNYVQAVVSSDIEARISTISQQILSRTNLQKIIEKFGLFSDPRYSGMFLEDMVGSLRNRIEVKVNRTRRQADAFAITFQGPDPENVMRVTNGLASSFIEENLRNREAQAVGTSDFLAAELEIMRKRLQETEQKLREYRRQHMGELPEQLDANLRSLERLQSQLSERGKSLREAKSRLAMIDSQIEANRKILTENRSTSVSDEGESLSLEQLKAQLAVLKSSYTDRHPDVVSLKARIAELEARQGSGAAGATGGSTVNNSTDPAIMMVSNSLNEQRRQRVEIGAEIRNLEFDIAKLSRETKVYQERVERTPGREQELLSLNRDYENIQDNYNSLLNRKLESEIAVNMEKKQKGEQFRIIDSAALPRKPISPDLMRLFALSVAAGLGIGAGLIFLLDFLNTSLKQPRDYESELGLTVLATIPKILGPKDKMFMRINLGLTLCSMVVAIALAAGFALLVFNGVEPTIEIVREFAKI